MLMRIYNKLLNEYGPQKWWPTIDKDNKFEIIVGAILTQNTNWGNVERALDNLINARALSPEKIARMNIRKLENLVRPSGFYKQKARRLKEFSIFVTSFKSLDDFLRNVTRGELLSINGIGRETADSILLYACRKPFFVIDAYTRRVFSRLKLIDGKEDYDEIRGFFEERIPRDLNIYKEYHALIVRLAKTRCKNKPECNGCILREFCRFC